MTTPIIPIEAGANAPVSAVGGKGHNLVRMLDAALQVPGGFTLSVTFFAPWFKALHDTLAWNTFINADEETLADACAALKEACLPFAFDAEQRASLAEFLDKYDDDDLFAVRSSSPEEDLEGSSFAGAYETVLGVNKASFLEAVKAAFVSCLDYRIASYKQQKGFAITSPKIAVVVQKQIASEIAGVGFSINPLNNSYDEAVFTANWGLGETVVSGVVSPDCITVEKQSGRIVEKSIGEKETSEWLQPNGGTEERRDSRHAQLCLTDEQVEELANQLQRVEAYYGVPVDIEWAFEDGQLHLLQSRPITTHHQLADEMLTAPGQPKRLYLDVTMSVQGVFEPLSAAGTSMFVLLLGKLGHEIFGRDISTPVPTSLLLTYRGRLYFHVNNMIKMAGKKPFQSLVSKMDSLSGEALVTLDQRDFPGKLKRLGMVLRAIVRMPPRVLNMIRALRNPAKTLARWQRRWEETKSALATLEQATPNTRRFVEGATDMILTFIARETLTMYISSRVAMKKIHKLFPQPTDTQVAQLEMLDMSLPGNVTVEMGLGLYELCGMLPNASEWTTETLKQAIEDERVPADFLAKWSALIEKYGHRANTEIDIASPRYWEQPELLLQQILGYTTLDPAQSPVLRHKEAEVARHAARDALAASLRPASTAKKFLRLHNIVEHMGGARETHKFVMVYLFDQVRSRLLTEARKLQDAGRLAQVDEIFDLSLDQIYDAIDNPQVDVQAVAEAGKRAQASAGQCKQIAPLMDSRGRFYRPPPREAGPGEVAGQGVAAGIASGPVKILHSPDEKPLLPGDILVARATDPAWTTLFVNAAGIILQVGGPLQHGALVAREYGKPCVSGVQNATERFEDGEWVEVNGASGIVRRIDPPEAAASAE